MKKKKLWGLLSILAAVLLMAGLLLTTVLTARGSMEVLAVTGTVAKGAQLADGVVRKVSVHKQGLPADIIPATEAVAGKYAAVDLVAGDFLLRSKVSSTPVVGDSQLSSLPSGKLAVSCSVPSLAAGLSNKLQPGDIVRMYQYRDNGTVLSAALTYVKVIAVSAGDGKAVSGEKKEEEETIAATVTVLADSAQAKEITRLEHEGGIHLALITRGDASLAERLLKEQDSLLAKGGAA